LIQARSSGPSKPILLIGTLDTKGEEIRYLKERLQACCRPALKSRTIGPKAILWHSNPGQRRRFALKPRTKLTATGAGHSEATAARSASPKTPAISARNTGLPSCVVARHGVYGQRLRYRWYSPDRKRRRSVVGHRRLFSIGSPRLVKIFMRRDCSIGVGRQGVLDSGCNVADGAQAEQGRGRAARCSCLGGCVLRDNALGTG